jgi:ABC-2 type transport system ATP-binding protein
MADNQPSGVAVRVDKVYKDFALMSEKSNSIKSSFTQAFRNKSKEKDAKIFHALRDISFEIKEGEFFGIVGRNGSGKSTLLKIIAGIYQPNKGGISVKGKLVPFIELGVGFNPELSGRENVFLNGALLGFSRKEMTAQYDDIVQFAELERFMDQKLKNYSSGMQVRLAFSLATRSQADILLVDEVLAVGDADFQRKCFDYFRTLKKNKKTVIFVSHDMSAIREYCERAVLIEKSKIIAAGSADTIASKYSRMFLEEGGEHGTGPSSKRWGDNAITYDTVSFKITGEQKERIEITAQATAHKHIEGPNFGFLVRSASGSALLGTNSHIKRQFVDHMDEGQKVTIHWEFENILNDGNYSVEPAIVYGGSVTADWWEEAAWVAVRKEEQVSYPINPPIILDLRVGTRKEER